MLRIFAVDKNGDRALLHRPIPASQWSEAKKVVIASGFIPVAELITPRAALRRHLMSYIQ